MTLTSPERAMTRLRKAAEAAEEASGLRAEIIRGVLMMSPTPRGKHAKAINDLYDRLRPVLPEHLSAFQVSSVCMPDNPDDYATPDLLICDVAFGDSDDWLVDPADVELVVEVVSKSNSSKDTRDMVEWYADAGIPAYLLVDPRDGTWILYTVPREGEFQGRRRGKFGEDVDIPGLEVTVATEGFPLYG
ncbi:Uma2 family endonuclease [Streptomyces sp. NPDC053474]|uniref:Uma2 family endonuclease n=1 Tax=Streptomyces sp. NPDC053474 TaxID=3365704 RepID=UPI0037D0EF1A